MEKFDPIGVLDSGVGGLTVLKHLKQMMPHENFIFLGDTARTPYGSRPEKELREFVEEMITWLEKQEVKLVVIACNTLTNLGVSTLKRDHDCFIIGMSRAEQLLLASSRNKKIGVMATPFTIKTGANKKAILAVDPSAQVYPMPCPKYVPLIESEQFDSKEILEAVHEYSHTLKEAGVDTLLLACTHYPFLKKEIAEEMGPGVRVVDPAEDSAMVAKKVLEVLDLLKEEGQGSMTICCTRDKERVQRLAERIMPGEKAEFREVDLHE